MAGRVCATTQSRNTPASPSQGLQQLHGVLIAKKPRLGDAVHPELAHDKQIGAGGEQQLRDLHILMSDRFVQRCQAHVAEEVDLDPIVDQDPGCLHIVSESNQMQKRIAILGQGIDIERHMIGKSRIVCVFGEHFQQSRHCCPPGARRFNCARLCHPRLVQCSDPLWSHWRILPPAGECVAGQR